MTHGVELLLERGAIVQEVRMNTGSQGDAENDQTESKG